MPLVYLAHDEQLDRRVAIKVPHANLVSQPGDAEAYLTEARTVANLDHAHIVPVFDVGSTADFPCYVVSKYIEGADLSTRNKESRLKFNDAAELIAAVAAHPFSLGKLVRSGTKAKLNRALTSHLAMCEVVRSQRAWPTSHHFAFW